MSNQTILLVLTLGCFSIILSGLIIIILGFELNVHTIYFSILIGAIVSILTGLFLKLRFQRINNQLKLSQLNLHEGEDIIIDGKASHNKVIGRLFLTDQRIVFLPKGQSKNNYLQSEISLDKITRIDKSKTAGLIHNGIVLYDSNTRHTFSIDFADDWCRIIDWQLLLTKSREKDFNSPLINSID
ncbi:GRAM domain-containing protein [Carboxylicivirga sp. RSCT41]|uniref:GRAM domain-containing protein n=1 Tax=Carboxylicivirga agarovorans TaxID=3417570 RepID=UPI003D34F341